MAMQRIPLYTCLLNRQPTDTVSARDLYAFLQLKRHFFHWVKTSSAKLRFVRGEDFILVDNLIRSTPETSATVQKSKDYFIRLDMAYEMAMEEDSNRARQASDYLRGCDTSQNRYIPPRPNPQDTPSKQNEANLSLHPPFPMPADPQVTFTDIHEYREASKILKNMELNKNGLALPIHEISKIIETMRLYQGKIDELQALSGWFEQHIANLKAYANSQFMDG